MYCTILQNGFFEIMFEYFVTAYIVPLLGVLWCYSRTNHAFCLRVCEQSACYMYNEVPVCMKLEDYVE